MASLAKKQLKMDMFVFASLIGIYSFIIFILGISGLLYKSKIIGATIIFWGSILYLKRKDLQDTIKKINLGLLVAIIIFQAGVNLIGVLGPERGFDALWYHLTLPKLYLINHSISFIPGGLLYYSTMPKLAEMLYLAGLSLGNETLPKLIHYFFGLLTCLALYKLQRKFFSKFIALIGVIIFYSNLVVGWESVTAYIDLVRTFFELMAVWGFVNWWESKKRKWLIISAVMVGFAIATKLLAIGSLLIFIILIFIKFRRRLLRFTRNDMQSLLIFIVTALIIPAPWFIFSYINTGNPVYPFFTEMYKVIPEPVSFFGFFKDIWMIFTNSPDHLSLVYILFLPFTVWCLGSFSKELKLITTYSVLAIIIWYFTPRTGGGRFIVPYLPAFSIISAAVINEFWQNKKYNLLISKSLVSIVLVLSLFSIVYRFAANYKYIPVIFGVETKAHFLANHLNFSFGDFYDIDGYFREHIKSTDSVLLYGFHNLYYVDFPFIDNNWVKKGDKFNYVVTQNTVLPKRFEDWKLIYKNDKTMVKLYKPPTGVCIIKCSY
ncbi:glycosyltransferase family 39 protein [Candidatus Roizmanbacteria bacterium]|nr:glycosyltransferase family 39 protein [Candidatus Roizmanbacteria bacterium]